MMLFFKIHSYLVSHKTIDFKGGNNMNRELYKAELTIKTDSGTILYRQYGIKAISIDNATEVLSKYMASDKFEFSPKNVTNFSIVSEKSLRGFEKYILKVCAHCGIGGKNENTRNDTDKLFSNIFRIR